MTKFNKKSLALAVSAILGVGFAGIAQAYDPVDLNSVGDDGNFDQTIHYAKEIKVDDTNAIYPLNPALDSGVAVGAPLDLRVGFGARVLADNQYYVRFDFAGATFTKALNAYNLRVADAAPNACDAVGETYADGNYTTALCDNAERNSLTGRAGDSFVVYHLKANTTDRLSDEEVWLLLNTPIDTAGDATALTGTPDYKPLKLTKKDGVTVQYRLYDKQAQAYAGETAGVFASVGPLPYIDFDYASFAFKSTDANVYTADCANPIKIDVATESTKFDDGSNTVCLGQLSLTEVTLDEDNDALAIYNKDGAFIAETVGIDALKEDGNTKLVVTGDFAAAKSGGKVYYAAGGDTCEDVANLADTVTDTSAEWVIGNEVLGDKVYICMQVNGTTTINGGKYIATLAPEAETGYVVDDAYEAELGDLKRNGTILQSPFFNIVDGYVARFYLTNTGKSDAKFTIDLASDAAAGTLTPGTVKDGTIPAGGAILLKATDIASAGQRGFAVFSVQSPTENIEGVFQFRNAASGDFDSYVMVKK